MPKNIYFWTINFKNMRLIGILVPLLSLLLGGCGRNEEYEPVEISRLDQTLPAGVMPDNAEELNAAKTLFKLSGYGELNDSSLAVYSGSPSIKLHTETLDKYFSDISDIEAGLGKMFGRMERICPEITIPKVYAIISPFNQSVFTVDTLLYIGVNHYLGLGYKPYDYFPEFIRRTKVRERIVPDVAETLIRKYYEYKPTADYPTLLSRLLYEGAIVDAVMRLTGQTEREALGYNEKEMEWLEDNEKKIWETLITRKMLYSTDETLAMRLISPWAPLPSGFLLPNFTIRPRLCRSQGIINATRTDLTLIWIKNRDARKGIPVFCIGIISYYANLLQSTLRISPDARNSVWKASDASRVWGV